MARRPPGYAFIEFDDRRDALDAIHELDGKFPICQFVIIVECMLLVISICLSSFYASY